MFEAEPKVTPVGQKNQTPKSLPMLRSFRRAECVECGACFSTESAGRLHAATLDHMVLELFEDYSN